MFLLQLVCKIYIPPHRAVGLQGIAGNAIANGIGTIVFTVTDNEGTKHEISLENVIHLPEASNNLIYIS